MRKNDDDFHFAFPNWLSFVFDFFLLLLAVLLFVFLARAKWEIIWHAKCEAKTKAKRPTRTHSDYETAKSRKKQPTKKNDWNKKWWESQPRLFDKARYAACTPCISNYKIYMGIRNMLFEICAGLVSLFQLFSLLTGLKLLSLVFPKPRQILEQYFMFP